MKKFFKLGKRMLALFSIAIMVLLNINSYAAVGANDGSAFVTKAEFDALINTFNEQMDTYQSGMNAKIDGAISNYLAGLSSEQLINQENLYNIACKLNKNHSNFRFFRSAFTPKETKLPTKVKATGEIVYSNNVGGCNVYFSGAGSINTDQMGLMYLLDDYNGLDSYYRCYTELSFGGGYGHGNSTSTITRTSLDTNPTEYGAYSKSVRIAGGNVVVNSGISLQKQGEEELYNNYLYLTVADDEIYYVNDKDKNKVKSAGTLTYSGSSNTVRDIGLKESASAFTKSGSWTLNIYDPYWTKKKVSEVLGNSGSTQAYGSTVMNYEGCPFVRCDTAGT